MEKAKEEERKWWEEHIDEESEFRKPHRTMWEYSRWQKLFSMLSAFYDFAGKRIFVGCCGTGIFEDALYKFQPSVALILGLDLTPKFIELAKVRNERNPKAKFVVGDLEETIFPDNYFDVAVVIDGLHHVPRPYMALREMSRIAFDLILSEPNALNPIRRINELQFRNQGVRESSFYEWQLLRWLKGLRYSDIRLTNFWLHSKLRTRKLSEILLCHRRYSRACPSYKENRGVLSYIQDVGMKICLITNLYPPFFFGGERNLES